MSIVTLPYSFANGDQISGTKIQADFDAIVNGVNSYFNSTVITSLPHSFADGNKLYAANVMANLLQIIKQVNTLSIDAPLVNSLPFNFTGFTFLDAVQFQADLNSVVGDINAIGFSAAAFLVGNDDTGKVSRSPTGSSWIQTDTPFDAISAVRWNGTLYCAIGRDVSFNHKVGVSFDGVFWQVNDMPSGNWDKLIWNGSTFLALDNNSNHVALSNNGISWTTHALPVSLAQFGDVAWNGTVFCCVTPDVGAGSVCATSPNGSTWTLRAGFPNDMADFVNICWNGTVFCAISDSKSCTSQDGITWSTHAGWPAFQGYFTLISNGTDLLSISSDNSLISPDNGVTWNAYPFPSSDNWTTTCWNGHIYLVMVFNNGTPSDQITISADGQTWTPITLPFTSLPVSATSTHLTFGTF